MYNAFNGKRRDQIENLFVTLILFSAPWIISFTMGLEGPSDPEKLYINWRLVAYGLSLGLPFAFICYIMSRNK